ncbi:hypothetical protein C8Q80DRAFT_1194033 [Daedaleopsis nitida]|nr:hypothetical protein C8Q80DRAFT_1194033 [Daedaleopsis nitida]
MINGSGEEPIIASSSRETESVAAVPCAICRRQFSRYTCPRCNIPYCSLICFRSEKHGDCSETFYRKEVELDVKSAPSSSVEEKRRIMDILKRFEEDALDESPLLVGSDNSDNEEGDNADDLHERLQNIDLDSASYDELWDALTPAERDRFLLALENPDSDLAKQILARAELNEEKFDPWWTISSQSPSAETSTRQHITLPPVMFLPDHLVKQSSKATMNGPLMLYNISALCVAYAYVVRHFAVSPLASLAATNPDRAEIRRLISQVVPFLVDRKSTMVLTSLSGLVTDLWSRFPPDHASPQFFSLLLKDTVTILRPAPVTVLASTDPEAIARHLDNHPNASMLRVLSDLASLYDEMPVGGLLTTSTSPKAKTKWSHVVHKLMFYAAYILGTPSPMCRVLADEAAMRAKTLEDEGTRVQAERRSERSADVRRAGYKSEKSGAKIEEL